jgi:hypothetical protein
MPQPVSSDSKATRLPLSGDVSQVINPWSWMNNSMGQFGYININQTVSSNRELEREIVTRVAGYGKQLGRITDVIDVLLSKLPRTGLDAADRKAIEDYRDMTDGIAAVKAGYGAPTEESVDRLIAGVRFLRDRDPAAYRAIVEKLRKRLPAGEPAGG